MYGERSGRKHPGTSLICARQGRRLLAPMLFEGSTDSTFFNFRLRDYLLAELAPNSTIIMDNAAFHKTAMTRKIIDDAGHTLLFLPPYSPDFNPVEKDFAIIKRRRQFVPAETSIYAVDLRPDWKKRMARLAVSQHDGPDPRELKERRRRLGKAYADGAFADGEYQYRLDEINRLLRLTQTLELPTLEEAGQLFENIPQLWEEATPEERRQLISPLIERVYVDMESRLVGAITPAPAFRTLLEKAMTRAESTAVMLLSEDEAKRLQVWSWWRRGSSSLPRTQQYYVRLAA